MLQPVPESKTGTFGAMDTWLLSCPGHGETAPTGNPCATAGRSTRYDSGLRHRVGRGPLGEGTQCTALSLVS